MKETSQSKKLQLLELARNGQTKPKSHTELGSSFKNYVYNKPYNRSYDPEFEAKIRAIVPDWFVNIFLKKRQDLLEMARVNASKPISEHPLASTLINLTKKSSHSYDAVFDKQIRELAPQWFFVNIINEKKLKLLEMAKNGEPKPQPRKHPLGQSFRSYTFSKNESSYDAVFCKKIKKIAPEWLTTIGERKKKQLIKMAKNGEPKPQPSKHPLGAYLAHCICEKSNTYKADFNKNLRELAPHWFETNHKYKLDVNA